MVTKKRKTEGRPSANGGVGHEDQNRRPGQGAYALIYCRVSSSKQIREGNGLASQESLRKQRAVPMPDTTVA